MAWHLGSHQTIAFKTIAFIDTERSNRYPEDILNRVILKSIVMQTPPAASSQIPFRYRLTDSATGVTRQTAKRLAEHLGVDETQVIHHALHELAVKLLPQYEADDGPLTASQLRQIRKRVPQGTKRSVRSSLFAAVTA